MGKAPWQVTIPVSQLLGYFKPKVFELNFYDKYSPPLPQFIPCPIISLVNQTYVPDWNKPDQWVNSVCLFDYSKRQYSEVYRYEYMATRDEQRFENNPAGSRIHWGPIVEIFDKNFKGTAPIGFDAAKIRECRQNNRWTDY